MKFTFYTLSCFILLFTLTACSQHELRSPKNISCNWKNINLNGSNNFCSSSRSSLIYKNDIFLAFDNGDVVQWNINSHKKVRFFDKTSTYTKRAFIQVNNEFISGSSDMKIYLHSLEGTVSKEENYSKGSIFKIIPYKDKLYVAFGNAEIGVVDKNNLTLLTSYTQHKYLVYTLMVDIQKKLLYAGSDDESISVWEILEDNTLKYQYSLENFGSAIKHILKIEDNIIITTSSGKILMYDTLLKKIVYSNTNSNSNITATLLKNNKFIVGDSIGTLYIYDIEKNSMQLNKKIAMNGLIRSINFFEDSIIAITKTGDIRTVKLNTY